MKKRVGWTGVFGAVAGLALMACGNSGNKPGGTAGAGGGTAGTTGGQGGGGKGGQGGGGNADAGCAVSPTVLASGQSSPMSIVSDGVNVYWANTGTAAGVMKVAVTGGTPVAVATGLHQPDYLAIDATH